MRRALLVGVVAVVVIDGCDSPQVNTGMLVGLGGYGAATSSDSGGRYGDSGGGGVGGTGETGQSGGSSAAGGQGAEGGVAGGGDDCNEFWLWYTVGDVVGMAECGPSAELCSRSTPWGVVVFDSEGRGVEITGLEPARVEEWLQEVADERWPCVAGQTVEYCCLPL